MKAPASAAAILCFSAAAATAELGGSSSWERVPTKQAPSARTSSAMCTLNDDRGILLFGGSSGESSSAFKNDTWLLAEGDWQELVTAVAPQTRSNPGMIPYKTTGAVLFGGFVVDTESQWGIKTIDDTWVFEMEGATWRQLAVTAHPSARAYFSFTPSAALGGGLLFGGRTALWTNAQTALEDTWIFSEEQEDWLEVASAAPATTVLQSLSQAAPSKRWGHVVTCGLNASVPDVVAMDPSLPTAEQQVTFVGPADCMLFGGAVTADEDYFADTWLLYLNGGKPVWKQQNNWPAPRGRWCHAAATCADPANGALMLGGSIDYRVSDTGTWIWTPTPIPFEKNTDEPGHPPGHTGEWELVNSGPTVAANGPNRTSGHMAVSDKDGVIVFGGATMSTGGNHPGVETNATWRWRC
jgi:hypothetical protein